MTTTVNDYTALLSGSYWNGIEVTGSPVIVTYSFPTSYPTYDTSLPLPPGFTSATAATFQAFTPAEQAQAIQALGEWSAASGLVFIQVAPGRGDINFQNIDLNTTSYAGAGGIGFYPFGDWTFFSYPSFSGDLTASGDVFMNSQFLSGGTVSYATLLHEIGHAIGLKHPTEVVTDLAAQPNPVVHDQVLASDDPALTIMATTSGGTGHLLPLDQNAAAFLYGPAGTGGVETTSGSGSNAVSSWSWDAATQTLTQTAATTNDTIRGSSVDDVIIGSNGDDRLFGLAGNDSLVGGSGNDSLYGGTGTNTLVGGAGDDSYFVDSATDTIIENPGEGNNDAVYATVSFTVPANVETLSLFGSGLTGTANNQGDDLFGDGTNATVLIGGTGNDYMVGGSGNDTIISGGGSDEMFGGGGADMFVFTTLTVGGIVGDFSQTQQDKIDLSAITTTGTNPGQPLTFIGTAAFTHHAGEVRDQVSGQNTFVEGDTNGDGIADFNIELFGPPLPAPPILLQSSDFIFSAPTCYRAGTHILTDRGEVTVENLAVGDTVMTVFGHACPVAWIGQRSIDCLRHPDPRRAWPVLVRAQAFAENAPHRDLWLSPDHAVFVDGVLIPIRQLINGTTIEQVPVDKVSYYHVELPRHDVLFAEGLPAESYLDTGNRGTFANAGGAIDLHPMFDAPKTWRDDAAAPLAGDEARVKPVWERLAARSRALGQPIPSVAFTGDPAVHLQVEGRLLRPVTSTRQWCRFVLPQRASSIRLLSRSGYPTDARPWLDDGRRLGVYVSRIIWNDGEGPHDMPVDHPALREGWWDVERAGTLLRRWTDGSALLPHWPGAVMVEFRLIGDMQYRLDAAEPGWLRAA